VVYFNYLKHITSQELFFIHNCSVNGWLATLDEADLDVILVDLTTIETIKNF